MRRATAASFGGFVEFPLTARRTKELLQSTGWCPADMRKEINRYLLRKKSYTTVYYYRDGRIRPDADLLDKICRAAPAESPLVGWAHDLLAGEYGEAWG
jgi:hypothetical protein